jgi:hypothetical protein
MNIAPDEPDQTFAAEGSPPGRPPETGHIDPGKHRPTRLSSAHAWLDRHRDFAVRSIFIAQSTQSKGSALLVRRLKSHWPSLCWLPQLPAGSTRGRERRVLRSDSRAGLSDAMTETRKIYA